MEFGAYQIQPNLVLESENESRLVVSDSLRPHGLYSPWNSPGQNTGVCSLSLLQDLPNQGLNPPTLQVDSLPTEPSGKQFGAYSSLTVAITPLIVAK